MRVTGCECEESGWCERHQCEKSRYSVRMCQRSARLFQEWEEGLGPGQQNELRPVKDVLQQPCLHLGLALREEDCDTCRGAQRIKVFTCDLYCECTLGKKLAGIQCCVLCGEYQDADAR